MVIVELKKSINIPLLVLGIERLKLSSEVYDAFELPNKGKAPRLGRCAPFVPDARPRRPDRPILQTQTAHSRSRL